MCKWDGGIKGIWYICSLKDSYFYPPPFPSCLTVPSFRPLFLLHQDFRRFKGISHSTAMQTETSKRSSRSQRLTGKTLSDILLNTILLWGWLTRNEQILVVQQQGFIQMLSDGVKKTPLCKFVFRKFNVKSYNTFSKLPLWFLYESSYEVQRHETRMEGIRARLKCHALPIIQKDFRATSRYFGKFQEPYEHANPVPWGMRKLINLF